jgi:hypothetical protein
MPHIGHLIYVEVMTINAAWYGNNRYIIILYYTIQSAG